MACRFLDGFDHYASAQILQKWTGCSSVGVNIYVEQGGGRESGGGAMYLGGGQGEQLYKTLTSESTWTVGFAFKATGGQYGALMTLVDFTSTANLAQVSLAADGKVSAVVNSGTYSSSAGAVTTGTWTYCEVRLVISATVGAVEVRINGTAVITETGIDTVTSGVTTADTLYPGDPHSGNFYTQMYFDDLYVFDGNGSANTTFPSAIPTVQCLWPNAPGTNAEWTGLPYPNFANVNDETPDGDFTVNQSGTVNQIDTFKHDALRPSSGTVFALQHSITARTSTAASHSIADAEYTGGTAYVGTGQSLPTGYTCATFQHDVDPATGAAYTVADVNAAEFGYELTA